jgi:3-deoxy-D-manno-octulosonic-acid transferase
VIHLLYNTGIYLYGLAIRIASLFSPKAKLFIEGRKNLSQRLRKSFASNKAPVAWFHCASLGEFEQARPLMEHFIRSYPDYKVLLTFFSPSGYEVRKDYGSAEWIYYLPLDHPSAARKFIEIVDPKIAFIIKYEYWYNLLKATAKKNIPIISVSSIFRENQLFFKPYGQFPRKVLHCFTHIFVQDERSLRLLRKSGISNVSKAGDTRFDRVIEISKKIRQIPVAERFSKNAEVFVIGSCWPQDMEVLTTFINENNNLKFILAPHNLDEKFMDELEHELMRKVIRFSNVTPQDAHNYEVLIIDNIGMLSSLYQYGKYAYVGGAFGQGLHNILEPAAYRIPVFFGNKNYRKFKEAIDLINLGGAQPIESYADLKKNFEEFSNEPTYGMISDIIGEYIKNNTGTTDIIMEYCRKNLRL